MILVGFGSSLIAKALNPPTEPPHMKPVNELELMVITKVYYWSYLGVAGIPVVIIGIILAALKRKDIR